jgi:hypothetical protein
LAVALELPEVALGAPLRREAEEDFVMVGDEKREKRKSYGGTGTEGYVGLCCWRKLEMLLKFEMFVAQQRTEISYDVRKCLR